MAKKVSMKSTIENISESLKEISVEQVEWAIDRHKADIKKDAKDIAEKGRRCFKSEKLFSFFDFSGDWQIHRVFQSVICVTDKRTKYDLDEFEEVSQYYLNVVTGEECYMQRPLKFMASGLNTFHKMRYKKFDNYYTNSGCYAQQYGEFMEGNKLHPTIRRNGLDMIKAKSYEKKNQDLREVMKRIVTDTFYETLIKSSQWQLCRFSFNENQKKAMLLNMRFGIDISSFSYNEFKQWQDAIDLMDKYGIDWHNPKLLADWERQHQVALKKQEKIKDKIELEKIVTKEADFAKEHKKYLNIDFSANGLNFHSLSSVREYYEEGKHMHHCVYANSYYKDRNSVIFSIRNDEGDRLATLEYDVKSKRIVQCRAVCNNKPERYDDMIKAFTENEWRMKSERKKKQATITQVAA